MGCLRRVSAAAWILFLSTSAFAGTVAAESRQPPAPWPTKAWTRSAPDAQGLDGERLDRFVKIVRADDRYPDIHGLLMTNEFVFVD